MDISTGFQIDRPNVFIKWHLSEEELHDHLDKYGLSHHPEALTRSLSDGGHYSLDCDLLYGLKGKVIFGFRPTVHGKLRELELKIIGHGSPEEIFQATQPILLKVFGVPSSSGEPRDGRPLLSYEWKINGTVISHFAGEVSAFNYVHCLHIIHR